MAASKPGFAYWKFDCDFWRDPKIRRLNHHKELKGYGIPVYLYLVSEAYRIYGSYVEWDESISLDIADYFGIKNTLVTECVNACCSTGLFDKELRANAGILTSKALQTRYMMMWAKSPRKNEYCEIPAQYNLVSDSEKAKLLYFLDIEDKNEREEPPPETQSGHLTPQSGHFEVQSGHFEPQTDELERQKKSKVKERKEKTETISIVSTLQEEAACVEVKNFFELLKSDEFAAPYLRWLSYKKQGGAEIKGDANLRRQLTRLKNEAGGDPVRADELVTRSILNGWKGFFAKEQKFKPPEYQEVIDYCNLHQLADFPAMKFLSYYASNGWRVGKTPMRDWQAAVRSWALRQDEFSKKGGNNGNTSGNTASKSSQRTSTEEFIGSLEQGISRAANAMQGG